MFETILERHGRCVLQFSGGKDSLACLYLLQPWWGKITVAWVNTGDAFPETVEQMAAIRAMVPNFLEIASNQPANVAEWGWPVEALPMTRTPFGRLLDGHPHPLMQPYFNCCNVNIWTPLQQAMVDLNATLLIRGTRLADQRKTSVRSGTVMEGMEFLHPIEDWSSRQVKDFLGDRLPAHYRETDTSLDCMHCTAFLYENVGKMRYMAAKHPAVYDEVRRRLIDIRDATAAELAYIDGALDHGV